MPMNVRNVVCGISGGVDSAVSALILKRKGYNVTGVFMKNWDQIDENGVCASDREREDALYVCKHLDIPFREVNFVKEYWNNVFSQMLQEYELGHTPNPDVLCNRYIKFGAFWRHAIHTLKADAVATGHYARSSAGEDFEHFDPKKGVSLLMPKDLRKDQTLFLSQIHQEALQRTMFPVGNMLKQDVRKMAEEAGMERMVKKRESIGICFIGKRNFQDFMEEYVEPKPGHFVDIESGKIVGEHKGCHLWTIGQRTWIGGLDKAYFVATRNPKTQEILVAKGTDHPALFNQDLYTASPHWINSPPGSLTKRGSFSCMMRTQHTFSLNPAEVFAHPNGGLCIRMDQPYRSIVVGQYAVFYIGDDCLGSAKISSLGPSLYDLQQNKSKQDEMVS